MRSTLLFWMWHTKKSPYSILKMWRFGRYSSLNISRISGQRQEHSNIHMLINIQALSSLTNRFYQTLQVHKCISTFTLINCSRCFSEHAQIYQLAFYLANHCKYSSVESWSPNWSVESWPPKCSVESWSPNCSVESWTPVFSPSNLSLDC